MAKGLQVGDTVAWHHTLAATAESVRRSTLPKSHIAADQDTSVGKIIALANEKGTWFDVLFENGEEKTLTHEELVKVVEDEDESVAPVPVLVAATIDEPVAEAQSVEGAVI